MTRLTILSWAPGLADFSADCPAWPLPGQAVLCLGVVVWHVNDAGVMSSSLRFSFECNCCFAGIAVGGFKVTSCIQAG